MQYDDFIQSLELASCPNDMDLCLRALWYDTKGDWDTAHVIVQNSDDWNSKYWHRRAGSVFPENMSLREEWDTLVHGLLA